MHTKHSYIKTCPNNERIYIKHYLNSNTLHQYKSDAKSKQFAQLDKEEGICFIAGPFKCRSLGPSGLQSGMVGFQGEAERRRVRTRSSVIESIQTHALP